MMKFYTKILILFVVQCVGLQAVETASQDEINQQLVSAVYVNNVPKVNELLGKKADVNTIQTASGFAVLHVAIMRGCLQIVKILLARGADKELCCGFPGRRPVHLAIYCQNGEILQALMDAEIDINAVDAEGNAAVHHAVLSYGNHQVFEQVVAAGANIYKKNDHGRIPLHLATQCEALSEQDEVEVLAQLEVLLDIDGDTTSGDRDGLTPLYLRDGDKYLTSSGISVAHAPINSTILNTKAVLLRFGADAALTGSPL